MKRQSVKSSNIVSIGWENDILEIEIYLYFAIISQLLKGEDKIWAK